MSKLNYLIYVWTTHNPTERPATFQATSLKHAINTTRQQLKKRQFHQIIFKPTDTEIEAYDLTSPNLQPIAIITQKK